MKRLMGYALLSFLAFSFLGCETSDESGVPANSDMAKQNPVSGNWERYSSSGDYGSKENLPGEPGIQITSVPPHGEAGRVTGVVSGVIPDDYVVAMYIRVSYQGWWIKPLFNTVTLIQNDGSWSANMVSGGSDRLANQVVVYLMPRNMSVPSALGSQSVPKLSGCPTDRVGR